jgi:hypothetical protein
VEAKNIAQTRCYPLAFFPSSPRITATGEFDERNGMCSPVPAFVAAFAGSPKRRHPRFRHPLAPITLETHSPKPFHVAALSNGCTPLAQKLQPHGQDT